MSGAPGTARTADRVAQQASATHRAAFATCALVTRLGLLVIAKVKVGPAQVQVADGLGVIIAMNHRSMLDFFVSTLACRQWGVYPHTVMRGDFFTWPVLGRALRLIGAIPAGRGRGAAATLRDVHEVLHHGGAVTIAPEGRIVTPQHRVDGLGELRGGIGAMSSPHGTPILLTAMRNTDTAWPLGRRTPVLHLPWNRPTITVTATWMVVETGAPPSDVTRQVAGELRALLRIADRSTGGR